MRSRKGSVFGVGGGEGAAFHVFEEGGDAGVGEELAGEFVPLGGGLWSSVAFEAELIEGVDDLSSELLEDFGDASEIGWGWQRVGEPGRWRRG